MSTAGARRRARTRAIGTRLAYADVADMHMRLAVAALGCDLTRVVTIALPEIPSELVGYTPGNLGASDLHDLVHKTAENGDLRDNPDALAPIKRYHQMHAEQFATLLDLLGSLPESDGGTLLDHTLVLWCGQLGSGSHDLSQLPWLLAEAVAASYAPVVIFSDTRRSMAARCRTTMFVSLANYMGVPVNTFGNPEVCRGPLTNLA